MARMTHLAKQSAEALRLAMENYRLYLGQPTDILGLAAVGDDLLALTPEEFAARQQSVLSALLGAAPAKQLVTATGEPLRQGEGEDDDEQQEAPRPALRAVGATRK